MNFNKQKCITAVILLLVAILSITVIGKYASAPENHQKTIASLDEKKQTVMELTDKIIKEKQLTALMVTHNLRYAVQYGDRLVMMHEGGTVKDIEGEEKRATTVDDLLSIFNTISIECGN